MFKKKIVSLALAFFVVALFLYNIADAAEAKYQIRSLTLDTKGKTLLLDDSAPNRDGKLYEYANGASLQDWKVKYEHKGSSRRVCEPPVLNLSFDKKDSNGNPKLLFNGVSTYQNYDQLQYQKIRLIPDCDVWTDYWVGGGDLGFDGQLDVNYREFAIHKIFRAFGVPTADVVAFANITFISTDEKYNGKTFRYMIIQRPQEQDDQIPFTKQYNLNSSLYESGSPYFWNPDYSNFNELLGGAIRNSQTNQVVNFSFDPDTTVRFKLLTDFLNLSDMGFLHNEDGGINLDTGKMIRIPHGFDASFSCWSTTRTPENIDITYLISNLDDANRATYQALYYKIAREIFGSRQNLDKMLSLVNSFPFTDVDSRKMQDYLKIKFYQYASYYNSQAFADSMNQTYARLNIDLPFSSQEEYEKSQSSFIQKCVRTRTPISGVNLSVTNSSIDVASDGRALINYTVKLMTSDLALQVFKNWGAFQGDLKNINSVNNYYGVGFSLSPESGAVDYAGPYYVVEPNTTSVFNLHGEAYPDNMPPGKYQFTLKSFTANSKALPLTIENTIDKTIDFGIGDVKYGPTAKIVDSNISIIFDQYKSEALKLNYHIKVQAYKNDLYVYKANTVAAVKNDAGGQSFGVLMTMSDELGQTPVVDKNGREAYLVRAGETLDFDLSGVISTRPMLFGSYYGELNYLLITNEFDTDRDYLLAIDPNQTEHLMIIGELNPFITAVEVTPGIGTVDISVYGFKLKDANVLIDEKNIGKGVYVQGAKDKLIIKLPSISLGNHTIKLSNPSGDSYSWNFEITKKDLPTISKPIVVLKQKTVSESDFNDGSALVPFGTEILLNWSSSFVDSCNASAYPAVANWHGEKSINGLSSIGKVLISRTYKLSCTGPGGSVEKSIDVMVQGKPVPVQPIPVTPVTPATTTPATTTPVVPVKPNPTMPTNTAIKLAEIYCSKGDWVGKNSVIGMWYKKDAKYNSDPRFLCHTDKIIYRCTKDVDETSGASYWNTFSTRAGDGAPTTNYVCSKSAGKWVNR